MQDHDVWEVIENKNNERLINCTWVFKMKKNDENIMNI